MPPASNTGKSVEVANAAGEAKQGEVAPPAVTVNLRYIGYIESVKSPRRLTALIILEGQAIPVREGEVVSEGVKIGKISPQEIEVILPDSSTRTFSLEGEGQ
jgi:multidrug efflux pump subunit AcrA (membrane-fusion protein)